MKTFFTAAFRNATLLTLAILVSGVLPVLVQGYAWIDMAQKAGGLTSLGAVLVDAESCEFCKAAQSLQKNNRSGNNQAPFSGERIDKKALMASENISTELKIPSSKIDVSFPIPVSSRSLRSLVFAPNTPPPRTYAA